MRASEAVLLQFFLGSPVFAVAALLFAVYLRGRLKLRWLLVTVAVLLCSSFALAGAVAIWRFWPSGFGDIMAVQFLNLPALFASVLIFPAFGLFFLFRSKPNNRLVRTSETTRHVS